MSWQDIFLTGVQIVFSLSLFVQVYDGFKEKVGPIKYLASVPTCLGLYGIAITYFTLSLYFSAVMACIVGTLWLMLAVQRYLYHTKKSDHQK